MRSWRSWGARPWPARRSTSWCAGASPVPKLFSGTVRLSFRDGTHNTPSHPSSFSPSRPPRRAFFLLRLGFSRAPFLSDIRVVLLVRAWAGVDRAQGADCCERRDVPRHDDVAGADSDPGTRADLRRAQLSDLAARHVHVPARERVSHPLQHARALDVRRGARAYLGHAVLPEVLLRQRRGCGRLDGPLLAAAIRLRAAADGI